MYIIAGLGNPGLKYAKTKHNMGFHVADVLSSRYHIDMNFKKGQAYCGQGIIEGEKVLLVKPVTYMNLSGESIASLAHFYKIDVPTELIVIYDDITLEPGNIRVRKKGSAGGHNGMKSIINLLGTEEFMRVRVGIGAKPPEMDLAAYVLSRFSKEEVPAAETGIERAADAVVSILTEGIDSAMNVFNRKLTGDE